MLKNSKYRTATPKGQAPGVQRIRGNRLSGSAGSHAGVHFLTPGGGGTDGLFQTFPLCRVYQAHIPTYPSGHWLFGFASKKFDPILDFGPEKQEAWNNLGLYTDYYNTDLHIGSFALPTYVKRLLEARDEEV